MADNLPKQYLTIFNRFQEAQRIGARKEKESLERARSVSYRRQSIGDSQMMDEFPSSNPQAQQQVVLSMEQEVDAQALRERGDQLHQLEVRPTSNIRFFHPAFLLDEYRRSERIIQRRGETRPRTRRNHRSASPCSLEDVKIDLCLDSIDQHIVSTETNVVTGNRQLVKAVSYQVSGLLRRPSRSSDRFFRSRLRHDGRRSF